MIPGGMSDLTIPAEDPPPAKVTRIGHDELCPVCASHDDVDCECECLCDFIADIRDDERRKIGKLLNIPDHAVAADNRP